MRLFDYFAVAWTLSLLILLVYIAWRIYKDSKPAKKQDQQ